MSNSLNADEPTRKCGATLLGCVTSLSTSIGGYKSYHIPHPFERHPLTNPLTSDEPTRQCGATLPGCVTSLSTFIDVYKSYHIPHPSERHPFLVTFFSLLDQSSITKSCRPRTSPTHKHRQAKCQPQGLKSTGAQLQYADNRNRWALNTHALRLHLLSTKYPPGNPRTTRPTRQPTLRSRHGLLTKT